MFILNNVEEKIDKSVLKEFVYFLIFLSVIFGIYLLMSTYMSKTYAVEGKSMYPTLHDKDIVYTEQGNFHLQDINRHDIVIIKLETGFNVVKRVIGVSGDIIKIEQGELYVNGIQKKEVYINEFEKGLIPADVSENIVPEGYIFVLGDNRLHSSDSRDFGFVNINIVQAKVKSVIWPLDRKGTNLFMY